MFLRPMVRTASVRPEGDDQQACRFRSHHPDDRVNAGAFNGDGAGAQPAGSPVICATLQDEAQVGSPGRHRLEALDRAGQQVRLSVIEIPHQTVHELKPHESLGALLYELATCKEVERRLTRVPKACLFALARSFFHVNLRCIAGSAPWSAVSDGPAVRQASNKRTEISAEKLSPLSKLGHGGPPCCSINASTRNLTS